MVLPRGADASATRSLALNSFLSAVAYKATRARCLSLPLRLMLSLSRVKGLRKPSAWSSKPRIACLTEPVGIASVEAWKPMALARAMDLGVTERTDALHPFSV